VMVDVVPGAGEQVEQAFGLDHGEGDEAGVGRWRLVGGGGSVLARAVAAVTAQTARAAMTVNSTMSRLPERRVVNAPGFAPGFTVVPLISTWRVLTRVVKAALRVAGRARQQSGRRAAASCG
jgi:hypothetical protein